MLKGLFFNIFFDKEISVVPMSFISAICNGKINPEGACSKYMEIRNRDGRNRTEHSQGDCQKPDLCICGSMNFYGEGGACKGIIRAQ